MRLLLVLFAAAVASAIDCAPPDEDCAQWNGFCAALADGCPEGSTPVPGLPCNAQLGGFACLCCADPPQVEEPLLTEIDCPCDDVDCGNSTCIMFYQENCTEICGDSIDNNCNMDVDEVSCENVTDAPTPSPTAAWTSESSDSSSDSDSESETDTDTSSDSDSDSGHRRRRRRRVTSWYWRLFGYGSDDDDDDVSSIGVLACLFFVVCICLIILASSYAILARGDEKARPPPANTAPILPPVNNDNRPVPLTRESEQFSPAHSEIWKID